MENIPGWNNECDELYNNYVEPNEPVNAEELLEELNITIEKGG